MVLVSGKRRVESKWEDERLLVSRRIEHAGTFKLGNFGIGINLDNCNSIHIIPPGYHII